MYKQTLYKIHNTHLSDKKIKHLNKHKKFEYGYNEDLDCVVISKDGTIGDIYEIQGLKVAIPKTPDAIDGEDLKQSDQFFKIKNKPESLNKIKSIYDFQSYPEDIKEKYYKYIDSEFNYRNDGYWFMCNGSANYITGSHYVYLSWTKIDVGAPDFRQANRIFYYFWEACKADKRSYGMCYLKNRRSGFSFMASSETVNLATTSKDSRFGVLSKTGADAKRCLQTRLYPYQSTIHFFSNQYRMGWNDQRRSYPIKYRQEDLPEMPSKRPIVRRNLGRGSIPRSTGRIRETTRTMEKSYNSSSMMNRVNGRGRTIYSTTGESRKRASGLEHE